MSINMESKPTKPSVMATLMGLDELPSQQPVKKQKQQRVLSENYLRKVASIGVWEKRSCDERRSFQFSIEEQKEFKDAFGVIESLERDKESDLFARKGTVDLSFVDAAYVPVDIKFQPLKEVHSGQSVAGFVGFVDSRKDCFENHFQKSYHLGTEHSYDQEGVPSQLQSGHLRFIESSYAFDREKIDICRKVGVRIDQENPKLLQKRENCLVKDSRRKYGPDSTCMVPRFHLGSNNERRRKIVILKPNPREAENATNDLSSPGSGEGSYSGNRKDKGFLGQGKVNSHAQGKKPKTFCDSVKTTGHRSVLSCEAEKEIIRKTRHNISNISLEPPRLGFSGVHSLAKEPKFMRISSPNNSDLNNWYKPSCYHLDGSYVALESKKKIPEKWRMTEEVRENGLNIGDRGRSRTLGEMLSLPSHDKCANFCSPFPLGISSRDGWQNGGVGDLIKSRSPAYSTSVEGPKIRSNHKALNDSYMSMTPMFSHNWSRLKSSKRISCGKDDLDRRNSGSICKKSQYSLFPESEKNHSVEDKYVIHDMFKNKLEKQDLSEENSIVSKSLKQDIVHSDCENKITPIDQWNGINDGNMSAEGCLLPESSVCTAASPSIAYDMEVTVETMGVGKSTGNCNKQQSESTGCTMSEKDWDSSFCIPDASSQQDDVSKKKSEECSTDPEFLVNLETAYQPSPVSVLEAPFEEEILSSSKCFQNVTASLHDVRRQLEFLKSESLEGYSEVVSSDDDDADDADAREESLEDCEANKALTRLFGVEKSWDFSYLVDVLNAAGFHSRNQDIGFDGWHSPQIPLSPSVFEALEKKYGEHISWKRSARRLLFDRINSGLMEILQPCLGEPMWAKPVARRLSHRQKLKEVEEELYMFLVSQEKEARKDSSEKVLGKDDGWLFLGYDVELIGREIENSLIDELAAEIVSLESF